MRQAPIDVPKVCVTCKHAFTADEVRAGHGWNPLATGWQCGDCGRARLSRVTALATRLLDDHVHYRWIATQEHRVYDECLFCETIATATQLLLQSGSPWRAGQRPTSRTADRQAPTLVERCSGCHCHLPSTNGSRLGWTVVRSGWRCPPCNAGHLQRVDKLAADLINKHCQHRWVGTHEHVAYDQCIFCDVIAEAAQRLLRLAAASS